MKKGTYDKTGALMSEHSTGWLENFASQHLAKRFVGPDMLMNIITIAGTRLLGRHSISSRFRTLHDWEYTHPLIVKRLPA